MHNVTRQFIWDQLGQAQDLSKCVVVTHHGPTHMSIEPQYAGSPLNPCYVSNWGDRIAYGGPKYWFHGHTHSPRDYMCGETRVICNPYGYPGERADAAILYMEGEFGS
jgi:hypothetical protein